MSHAEQPKSSRFLRIISDASSESESGKVPYLDPNYNKKALNKVEKSLGEPNRYNVLPKAISIRPLLLTAI